MNILIISNSSWREDNSFGSTFSNIFSGINDVHIANIFCSSEAPSNNLVELYYQMSDSSILMHIINHKNPVGRCFTSDNIGNEDHKTETGNPGVPKSSVLKRLSCFEIAYIMRAFAWDIGQWKNNTLKDFIQAFKPDVLFCPLYSHEHMLKIVRFIQDYSKVPSVCYMADDGYTLKQYRLSPIYWVRRLYQRKLHRDCIKRCNVLYVISEYQKQIYEKIFDVPCKVLCKCADFNKPFPSKDLVEYKHNSPISFVYTGNIGTGRWVVLVRLAQAIQEHNNKSQVKANLHIYSGTPLTNQMKKAFESVDACEFHGSVDSSTVGIVQQNADYLVHVESFKYKYICQTRLSFSTKIIDYIAMRKPIIAIGPKTVASIQYLSNLGVSCCIMNLNDIDSRINAAIDDIDHAYSYAKCAWEYASAHNSAIIVKDSLYSDLKNIADGKDIE